jgi:hypothetical protein
VDELEPLAAGDQCLDLGAREDAAAAVANVAGQGCGDGAEVDDTCLGRVQRGEPAGVWLDLRDLLRPEPAQAADAVGGAAALELVEPRQLLRLRRDDQLALAAGLDAALLAVFVETTRSLAFSDPGS